MDQYIGKLLDNRYEILECVGTGGMAVVYKARCHRLNRLVAVKILKPELARDAEFRRRFHDESQAVAMLSHPNIVAVYDVSRSDDMEYIVMELIDGITLKQYMQKKGLPLNWREALHFITQIAKALSHAHSRGIIHRDIKPQNIMVLRDGSVKVADFGIARLASAAQSTLTQEALGSVHYISPEQARGSHIDSRSDLYSAGVVLYEMTAGRLPYEGDTPVSVAIQHINSIPLPTRDVNPDIPDALEAITMKAMASDVEKRYVSADAMLADLEEFRKNPSINFEYTQEELFQGGAVDEPTIIRSREDTGSHRRRRDYEEDEEDYLEDRGGRGSVWPVILAIGAILVFIAGIIYFLWTTIFGGILADQSTEVVVPNLVGMTIEEVNRDISLGSINDAFLIVEGHTVVSDLPAGQIVFQDPSPNERRKGEEITIIVNVSAGPEQLVMPDVVNEEHRQALELLQEQLGLVVNQEYENSEEVTRNYVTRSEPIAGTNLEPGQTVTMVISLGPVVKTVMVPDFTNQHIDNAYQMAEGLNLSVTVHEKVDTTHEKGWVTFQSIPVDSEVPEGSSITFHISSGPTDDVDPGDNTGTADDPLEPSPEPGTQTTPEPTPSPTPSPDAPPAPEPSEELPVIATPKTVYVDLSGYTEPVQIRVEVGGTVQHNSPAEPALGTFVKTITGTGQQRVVIYINDVVVQDEMVDFSE